MIYSWFFKEVIYDFSIYSILYYFLIYAFLGWVVEVSYAAIKEHKFINRGFLNGPVCPIYGAGAVIVLIMLYPVSDNPFLVFLVSILITSFIEFLTGFILEKIYHKKWWDYSERKFNIKGYICLEFSFIWGVACIFVYYGLNPLIRYPIKHVNIILGVVLISIFLVILVADIVLSTVQATRFARYIRYTRRIADRLKSSSNLIGEKISNATIELTKRYNEAIEKVKGSRARIIKAFPSMKDRKGGSIINEIRKKWIERNKK